MKTLSSRAPLGSNNRVRWKGLPRQRQCGPRPCSGVAASSTPTSSPHGCGPADVSRLCLRRRPHCASRPAEASTAPSPRPPHNLVHGSGPAAFVAAVAPLPSRGLVHEKTPAQPPGGLAHGGCPAALPQSRPRRRSFCRSSAFFAAVTPQPSCGLVHNSDPGPRCPAA